MSAHQHSRRRIALACLLAGAVATASCGFVGVFEGKRKPFVAILDLGDARRSELTDQVAKRLRAAAADGGSATVLIADAADAGSFSAVPFSEAAKGGNFDPPDDLANQGEWDDYADEVSAAAMLDVEAAIANAPDASGTGADLIGGLERGIRKVAPTGGTVLLAGPSIHQSTDLDMLANGGTFDPASAPSLLAFIDTLELDHDVVVTIFGAGTFDTAVDVDPDFAERVREFWRGACAYLDADPNIDCSFTE